MANQSSIQFNNYYIFAGRIKVSATFFFLSRNMSVLFDELTIYKNEEYYGKRERDSTSSIPGMLNLIHIFNRTLRSIHSDSIVLVDQSIQLNICLCVCVCVSLSICRVYWICITVCTIHCVSPHVTNIFAGQWIDDHWTIFAYGIRNNDILLLSLSSAFIMLLVLCSVLV